MRLMTWLFTVPPFAMTLLFAAVLLKEGYERTTSLYRRAYSPRVLGGRRRALARTTSPFETFRSREA
jgi:hypothetical protein